MSKTIQFTTKRCPVCRKTSTFTLDKKAFEAWQKDTHVQKAFPAMPADQREQLISGTHGPCWDRLMGS